jgi:Tfp pilus assembly protein PilV
VILAAALTALFVVSLLGLALVQLVLIHHRQEQVEAQRQQCFWLAESGVQRALARLAKSPDYAGETWTIPSAAFGGVPMAARPPVPLQHGQQAARGTRALGGATVTIEVKAGQPGEGRKIHVEARFPDDPVRRIVCEREILINRSR